MIQINIYHGIPYLTQISFCSSHLALFSTAYIHHVLATEAIKKVIWKTKLKKYL